MMHPNPYESPTQSSPLPTKSRPRIMNFLNWPFLAIVLSVAHGLLNWWSVSNISGGFWVMEGGGQTPVEHLAEALTWFLNFPSLLICFAVGLGPFGFTMPILAIANSCLFGGALTLLAFAVKKRRERSAIEV